MKIALGTTRASKIDAVRAVAMQIAEIDSGWRGNYSTGCRNQFSGDAFNR
jgi:hypothetical protein